MADLMVEKMGTRMVVQMEDYLVGTMAVMMVCQLAEMTAGWLVECSAVMKVASMVFLLVALLGHC
jgi:hypothetical protein